MTLRKLTISHFKSIYKASVDFGRVNLFIGGNGSGKSNVLEALGVVSSALARGLSSEDLLRKGIRNSAPVIFKSSFKNHRLPRALRLEAEFASNTSYAISIAAHETSTQLKIVNEKGDYAQHRVFGRSGHGAKALGQSLKRDLEDVRGIWDQTRAVLEYPNDFAEQLDLFSRFAIYAPQTEFLRGIESGNIAAPPLGLHGEGLALAFQSMTNRLQTLDPGLSKLYRSVLDLIFLPGWASRVSVRSANPLTSSKDIKTGDKTIVFLDKFMQVNRRFLTAYDASEGTLFLMFIATALLHHEMPRIFAMDNVDNSLNPAMTKKALSLINYMMLSEDYYKNDIGPKQIFMTSHNPTALDAFDLFEDKTRIFVVNRNTTGATEIHRLEPPKNTTREDWIRSSGGRTLSELWIENKIPNAFGNMEL